MIVTSALSAQNARYNHPAAAAGTEDEPRETLAPAHPPGEVRLEEVLAALRRSPAQRQSPYEQLVRDVEPMATELAEALRPRAERPRLDLRRILQRDQLEPEIWERRERTLPSRKVALVLDNSVSKADAMQAAALLSVACQKAEQPLAVIGPSGAAHSQMGEHDVTGALQRLDAEPWQATPSLSCAASMTEALQQLGQADNKVLLWMGRPLTPEYTRFLDLSGVKVVELPLTSSRHLAEAAYRGLKPA